MFVTEDREVTMDERYRPDWLATAEEVEEYERLQEQELGEGQAEQNERIARKERKEAAARAGDSLGPQATEPEWLPISISRTRGQNTADTVELADLEISAFDDVKLVDFQIAGESPDEARGPTPPPERVSPSNPAD